MEECGEYHITRHKGPEPDSKNARVIFRHSNETLVHLVYNDALPAAGTVVAMWRPDGSLVAFRSGPPPRRGRLTPQ
jgi:hypothetical protein